MPSHEQIVSTINAYVAAFAQHDTDAIVRLYAEEATVEDPVGTPLHRGLVAIRAFYAAAVATGATLTLEGPVRSAGNSAAFPFSVHVPMAGAAHRIDVIDTFTFNDAGKIVEMRAFWGPQNVATS